MSREQRRADRKQQARATGGGPPPPSRRTPVKAPRGGVPWNLIAIAGGALIIVLLIVYLVLQQGSDGGTGDSGPELDADPSLPGVYIPPQGRGHFQEPQSLTRLQTPFCDDVARSDTADEKNRETVAAGSSTGTGTPRATNTPSPTRTVNATTAASGTALAETPTATPTVRSDCFLSNPPTSGMHLGSQRSAEVAPGVFVEIPPQNLVLPDDVELPRDAIPHVLEHAGVFIGWHCAEGDQACLDVVQQVKDLAEDRISNHDNRVVMGIDTDLPAGEIGVSSWTRVLNMKTTEIDLDQVRRFISAHSCRFDPEGFC